MIAVFVVAFGIVVCEEVEVELDRVEAGGVVRSLVVVCAGVVVVTDGVVVAGVAEKRVEKKGGKKIIRIFVQSCSVVLLL